MLQVETAPQTRPERRVILVVEDDPTLLSSYTRLLNHAGFDVDAAETAAEARARLAAGTRFSAVVSDLWLPDETAIEFLGVARAADPDLPILLLTAEPTVDTAIDAIAGGVRRYLRKPITAARLLAEVEDAAGACTLARAQRQLVATMSADTAKQREGRQARVGQLDAALQGMWLAAQPIVRVSTGGIWAYELLLRSRSADLPTPLAVVDAAEQAARLPELAKAVRTHAARRASSLAPGQRLFVNLHPADLLDPALLAEDDPLLPHAGRVTLEVTERARLEGVRGVDEAVHRIRAAGYQIAVDDFGSGYSGLTSLANLVPDVVKLDMGLIRGIDRDRTRQRLVRSTVDLCRDLGAHLIAEGIETPAERDALLALGCDLHQGYYYARPGEGFPTVDAARLPVAS